MGAELLYINEATTRQLLTPKACMEIVERVFRWHASGHVVWPDPRQWRLKNDEFSAKYHIKGCLLPSIPVFGVRTVGYHVRPDGSGTADNDNMRYVLLQDPTTGRPLALVDEHWNYALRTTTSALVACKYLALPGSSIAGIIGVGNMGFTALLGLQELFDLKEVRVTSRRPESREAFANRMGSETGLNVTSVDTPEQAVREADIVIVGTTAGKNLVFPGWLKPGAFIATLAADEVHDGVYREVEKIIVDDWDQNENLPDVRGLIDRGALSKERVHANIAEVVSQQKAGRENPSERILVRTEGLVSQDVAIAHWVYQEAMFQGLGQRMA